MDLQHINESGDGKYSKIGVTLNVLIKYLFFSADPTERNNLAQIYPDIVQSMLLRLDNLKQSMIAADDPPVDKTGDPKLWNGNFSPGWCTAN